MPPPRMKPYTDEELLSLLRDQESDRCERKANFGGEVRKSAHEAVCAFANDLPGHNQPGVLFIGVTDAGTPSGLEITEELLTALSDMKTDGNILPLPTLTVEKRTLSGTEVAVVTVLPADAPPVRYRGRICIRAGPRRAYATPQEERILNEKRRHRDIPFDLYPISRADLSDLSRSIFENDYLPAAFAPDVLEANDRTYPERLASCRMIVAADEPTPTVSGLLALGISPQDFIPGAYIQFLRIDGTELADPVIDAADINGNIVGILRQTTEKLRAHNRIAVDIISSATHRIEQSYPLAAIDQIVYNAILHRTYEGGNTPVRITWYNDRIEIISPGGPYGSVTAKNFGKPDATAYRNPAIADILKTFGYIQKFGRGIATARAALRQNGNPDMQFEVDQSFVRAIIMSSKK